MKLSIGMIVKNESKYLNKCLMALKPLMDAVESELIIVDTGSTDDTIEIAKKYTDKVFFHEWNDDFSEARNLTIKHSIGEWFFYLDADEILEDAEDLIRFFSSKESKKYNLASINIKNIDIDGVTKDLVGFVSPRICRNEAIFFKGKIHEQINYKGPVYTCECSIIHYGYISTDLGLMERKFIRNKELIIKELKNEPDNHYLWYQLYTTYSMHKDYEDAIEPIEKAYEIVKRKRIKPFNCMYVYNALINTYIDKCKYNDAERICIEAINSKQMDTTGYIDTYFFLAIAQTNLYKNKEAVESFKKYLELLEKDKNLKLTKDYTVVVYTIQNCEFVYFNLSNLYERLENFEEAFKYALMLENKTKTINRVIEICLKFKKYDNLLDYYKSVLDDEKCENRFVTLLEEKIRNNNKTKGDIIKQLAVMDINTNYVFLNKIRVKSLDNQINFNNEILCKIKNINFKDQINIYGEFIYYLMKEKVDVSDILIKLNENEINNFMQYLQCEFDNFCMVVYSYFEYFNDKIDLSNIVYSKAFKRVVLIIDKLNEDEYKNLFKRYIKEGIYYIENVYLENIIESEMINVLKNEEEIFLLYMSKASNTLNDRDYVRYLRKALNAYPYMKRGIEILLDEFKEKYENTTVEVNEEFEEYKEIVKKNISELIDNGNVGEAKILIEEYIKIIPTDIEMLMLKSRAKLLEQ